MLQTALAVIYPHQCATCDAQIAEAGGLCGPCWREAPFVSGPACDRCGLPLVGDDEGQILTCDQCLTIDRPWRHGRAAFVYGGTARRMVLALKHGDRLDLVGPAARHMVRAAGDILSEGMVILPVPSHWTRRIARRHNQAAELAKAITRLSGTTYAPRALVRHRRTAALGNSGQSARFAALDGVIRADARRGAILAGRPVLIVDDVMTSGATLAACAEACLGAGATSVDVCVLARAAPAT